MIQFCLQLHRKVLPTLLRSYSFSVSITGCQAQLHAPTSRSPR